MGLGLGAGELVFIFLIVLLLFGAKRLPEIGSSLGKGIREFKTSVTEIERELKLPKDNQIHRPSPTVVEASAPEGDEDGAPDADSPPDEGSTPAVDGAVADSGRTEDGEPRTLSDSVPAQQ